MNTSNMYRKERIANARSIVQMVHLSFIPTLKHAVTIEPMPVGQKRQSPERLTQACQGTEQG